MASLAAAAGTLHRRRRRRPLLLTVVLPLLLVVAVLPQRAGVCALIGQQQQQSRCSAQRGAWRAVIVPRTITHTAAVPLLDPTYPVSPLSNNDTEGVLQELMGYQEGSQRSVKCKGGGYFTALELSFASLSGFSEKVVVGLRLRCST